MCEFHYITKAFYVLVASRAFTISKTDMLSKIFKGYKGKFYVLLTVHPYIIL